MTRHGLLTSGDVACLCRVGLGTVNAWVDKGLLKAFRTPPRPGGFKGQVRVNPAELKLFMTQHGMPETWVKEVPG